jgi:hypothetical protein
LGTSDYGAYGLSCSEQGARRRTTNLTRYAHHHYIGLKKNKRAKICLFSIAAAVPFLPCSSQQRGLAL